MNEYEIAITALERFKGLLAKLLGNPFCKNLAEARAIFADLKKYNNLSQQIADGKLQNDEVPDLLRGWKLQLIKIESYIFDEVSREYEQHAIAEHSSSSSDSEIDLDKIERILEDYLTERDKAEKQQIMQLESLVKLQHDKSAQRVNEDGELPLLEIRRAFMHNRKSPIIIPMQPKALKHSFIPIKKFKRVVPVIDLRAEKLFPNNMADFSATNQGFTGDCYLLATLDATLNTPSGAHYLAGVMRDMTYMTHITGNKKYVNKILVRFGRKNCGDYKAHENPSYLLLDKSVLANDLCAINSKLWVTIFEQAFNCVARNADWLQQRGGNFTEVSHVFFNGCDGASGLMNEKRDIFYRQFWQENFEKNQDNLPYLTEHGFTKKTIGILTKLKKMLPDEWKWPRVATGYELTLEDAMQLFKHLQIQKIQILNAEVALKDDAKTYNARADAYTNVLNAIHNMIIKYCPPRDQTKLLEYQEKLFSEFKKALSQHRPIYVSTYEGLGETMRFGRFHSEGVYQGLAGKHAYAVLDLQQIASILDNHINPDTELALTKWYMDSNAATQNEVDALKQKNPNFLFDYLLKKANANQLPSDLQNELLKKNIIRLERFIIVKNPWGQFGVSDNDLGPRVKSVTVTKKEGVVYTMESSDQSISRLPWRYFLIKMQQYTFGNPINSESASQLSDLANFAMQSAKQNTNSPCCKLSVFLCSEKPIDIMNVSVSRDDPIELQPLLVAQMCIGFIREDFYQSDSKKFEREILEMLTNRDSSYLDKIEFFKQYLLDKKILFVNSVDSIIQTIDEIQSDVQSCLETFEIPPSYKS